MEASLMDEKTPTNGPDPGVGQGGGTADPARRPRPAWPTRQERLARIRDYQAKALQTGDPHLANLELFDGDAMLLAFRLRESLGRELTGEGAPPEAAGRFAH